MKRKYTDRPGWVDTVDVGSVLISPTGDFRVIRKVSRGRHWRHPIFSFAIRRCSWTRRPYTIYTWGELVRMGYTTAETKVALDTRVDKLMDRNLRSSDTRTMFCWDVCGGQLP